MMQLPIRMPNLPPGRESVDTVVSAANLKAVAAATSDPETLLGLAVLASSGDPVRKELSEMAARARSEYVPVIAVLTVAMDRIDTESVGELLRRDPENALGHYLHGTLLHIINRASEALDAFRKAAACSELRLYDSTIGGALFKALDVLNLKDLDRLCALSWAISRWSNFSSAGIQPTYHALSEIPKANPAASREVADILLTLAGHLFATNFTNRWFAQRAVEASFTLKAENAGVESRAKRNGYAAAVCGLTTPMLSCPGLKEWWDHTPLQLAQFLPGRIWRAFSVAEGSFTGYAPGEKNLSASDRAALEAAMDSAAEAAKKLLDVTRFDPDGVLGPYFKVHPQPDRPSASRPLFDWTPVEGLVQKRPDLFRAAAANEEAMARLWSVGENSPSRKNIERLMKIAWAIQSYAQKHNQAYPDSIAALFEDGSLKPPLEAKSLLTGRPYVYTAAGEKDPGKINDRASFVLVYDDEADESGCYPCAFALVGGGPIRVRDLEEHLKRRGK